MSLHFTGARIAVRSSPTGGENQTVSGKFITKGDANEKKDPMPVDYDELLGKVALSVPFLGRILATVATTSGKAAAACLIGVAVIFLTSLQDGCGWMMSIKLDCKQKGSVCGRAVRRRPGTPSFMIFSFMMFFL